MATKQVESMSKKIKVELTSGEVSDAIKQKAGAKNASDVNIQIDDDGSATVTFTITK